MQVTLLKSKIHFGRLTGSRIEYEGSVGISRELLDAAGLLDFEKVLVANVENGSRLWTYVIPLDEPGQIVLNGAAAHHGKVGDRVIIMAFAVFEEEEARGFTPRIVRPDHENRIP